MRTVLAGFLLTGVVLATLSPVLTGCRHYHAGSVMHGQFKSVAVGAFANDTDEPGLGVHLRQKLADSLMTDGSVTPAPVDSADAVLTGRILRYSMENVASHRIDIQDARDNNRSKYQTSLYKTEVEVEFELKIPGMRRAVLEKQVVRGTAQYSSLPDLNVARDEALRRAAQDAARQIAAAVTEGW